MSDAVSATGASASPPPPPPDKSKEMTVIKFGKDTSTTIHMSSGFLKLQKEVSLGKVFQIYRQVFMESFFIFEGTKKPFDNNLDVYGHYLQHFRSSRLRDHESGWIGGLSTNQRKEIVCHFSWLVEEDTGDWLSSKFRSKVEEHMGTRLFEYLHENHLFDESFYVEEAMMAKSSISLYDFFKGIRFNI